MPWTARYRFRVSKPLTSEEKKLSLTIGGRAVTFSSSSNVYLKESNWLTINAHEFESEDDARSFGQRIANALLLGGIRRDVGIDAGNNEASTRFSKEVTDKVEEHGKKLMPNVHGLQIYERTGSEVFFQLDATASVSEDPAMFFDEVGFAFEEVIGLGEREQTALNLIALSKLAREPLAEAALCISAIEYLSAIAPWTLAQDQLLQKLKSNALSSSELPIHEAREVADGIERIFKSIRQSIKRLIKSLGLSEDDWKAFDEVYSLRSGIFHGTIVGKKHHVELASKARTICARIVLAAEKQARSSASEGGVLNR
jgi:hypothetical protein